MLSRSPPTDCSAIFCSVLDTHAMRSFVSPFIRSTVHPSIHRSSRINFSQAFQAKMCPLTIIYHRFYQSISHQVSVCTFFSVHPKILHIIRVWGKKQLLFILPLLLPSRCVWVASLRSCVHFLDLIRNSTVRSGTNGYCKIKNILNKEQSTETSVKTNVS